jgi:hypothetical protein
MLSQESAWTAVFFAASVVPLLAGCGGGRGAPPRVAVRGEVRLDAMPLKAGVIRFVPQAPAKGPVALGTIKDGHFAMAAATGATPGRNAIEIVATPAENPLAGATDARAVWTEYAKTKRSPPVEAAVPARYNQNSTLSVEVSAKGPNAFDFQLAGQ